MNGSRFAIREGGRTVGLALSPISSSKIYENHPPQLDSASGGRFIINNNLIPFRGVAQLAERWSPKPEVASSIPAAPAILRQGRGSPWVRAPGTWVDLLEVF